MIRRTFLRRMASAAMAGMLGAELMWRAPKVDYGVFALTEGTSHTFDVNVDEHVRRYWALVRPRTQPLRVVDVDVDNSTITVE